MSEILDLARACRRLPEGPARAVLATLVGARGSTLRRPGARLLWAPEGGVGCVAGGCVEADLDHHARRVLAEGIPRRVRYRPGPGDLVFGTGSGCDGELDLWLEPVGPALRAGLRRLEERLPEARQVLLTPLASDSSAAASEVLDSDDATVAVRGLPSGWERGAPRVEATAAGEVFLHPFDPPPTLALFGGGPVVAPLAAFGRQIGWRVVVADHRPAAASRSGGADEVVVAPAAELVAAAALPAGAAAVVASHNYVVDRELLRGLAPLSLAYLGVVGSARRWRRLREELGLPADAHLHGPAGLDLDAETPAEIALAVAAQVQMVLRGASGRALRDVEGPVHRLRGDSLTVAVLAAGGSSRLGRPKQLLRFDGETLVRRAAREALASGAEAVVVITGAAAREVEKELVGLPVACAYNASWRRGMGGSLALAARWAERAGSGALLVTMSDLVGVDSRHLRGLADLWHRTGAPAVATAFPEGPGSPAVLGRELYAWLQDLDGDAGARELLRRLDDVPCLPLGGLRDVDTPEDAAALGFAGEAASV